jgi:hypothetical protein
VTACVDGNTADAVAEANAYGYDTFSGTATSATTTPYSSSSYSASTAVTG